MNGNALAISGYSVDGQIGTMSIEIIVNDDFDDIPYYCVTIVQESRSK